MCVVAPLPCRHERIRWSHFAGCCLLVSWTTEKSLWTSRTSRVRVRSMTAVLPTQVVPPGVHARAGLCVGVLVLRTFLVRACVHACAAASSPAPDLEVALQGGVLDLTDLMNKFRTGGGDGGFGGGGKKSKAERRKVKVKEVRCGAVRCGAVRCGAVRCGVVRCGAVRCGAVRCRVGGSPLLPSFLCCSFHRRCYH
jgi:hypothetical protein